MNILLTNSTGIFAGAEDYVLILARYLRLRGHAVWVSAIPNHLLLSKCEAEGIPTVPLEYGNMARLFAISGKLRRVLNELKIDIVHSNANYDRTAAALASSWLPVCHVAGVHSAHSIQHNVTHWMRNRFGVEHFIADSLSVKEVLVREDGIDPRRVTVMPIGIEHDEADAQAQRRQETRAQWGVAPETIVVGNVARLVPFKGQRWLLDAAAIVARQHRDLLVPIVGDGELLHGLRAQAASLGCERIVRFLGFREDLQNVYPAFDIYCHPSLEMAAEAFPIAMLRALAAGLPVVCTRVGDMPTMVEDGVSGYVVEPENSEALAAALLRIIRNPDVRASMGRASFSRCMNMFHASAMAERVEGVYLRASGRIPGELSGRLVVPKSSPSS